MRSFPLVVHVDCWKRKGASEELRLSVSVLVRGELTPEREADPAGNICARIGSVLSQSSSNIGCEELRYRRVSDMNRFHIPIADSSGWR